MIEASNQNSYNQNEAVVAGLKFRDVDVIYTMPKRFLNSAKKHSSRSGLPWLWIMVAGAVVLVGVFIGLYAYLSRTQNTLDPSLMAPYPEPSAPVLPREKEALTPITNEPAVPALTQEENLTDATESTQAATTAESAVIDVSNDIVQSEQVVPDTGPRPVEKASDLDNDGLSDLEEMLLDSSADSFDTDQDGYDDRSELLNLFNPAGAGQPLIANPNIRKYTNNSIGYSLYHPLVWPADPQSSDDSLIFRLPNNQFVQVLAMENPGGKDLESWYKDQFNVVFLEPQQLYFKKDWSVLRSPDGLNYYLANPRNDLIFTLSYNIGLENSAAYITVFEMMVKSFDLGV